LVQRPTINLKSKIFLSLDILFQASLRGENTLNKLFSSKELIDTEITCFHNHNRLQLRFSLFITEIHVLFLSRKQLRTKISKTKFEIKIEFYKLLGIKSL
jgi:hypothetical protein